MLKSLKRNIINFFGGIFGANLSADQKNILGVICTLYIGIGLSGTFINIFLFSVGNGLENVLIYNSYFFGSVIVSSVIMGFWSKKIGSVNCIYI